MHRNPIKMNISTCCTGQIMSFWSSQAQQQTLWNSSQDSFKALGNPLKASLWLSSHGNRQRNTCERKASQCGQHIHRNQKKKIRFFFMFEDIKERGKKASLLFASSLVCLIVTGFEVHVKEKGVSLLSVVLRRLGFHLSNEFQFYTSFS